MSKATRNAPYTDEFTTAKVEDPVLNGAIQTINKNIEQKIDHDGDLERIQKLFDEGFEVSNPTGSKKIGSKTLQQALWKTVNKMRFLDFQIHGAGRPELVEKVVTDGVATVADEGGLLSALRDKQGTFWSMALYGDGFIQIGTDQNSDYPIQFSTVSPSNVYVDNYATSVRSAGNGRDATQMVIVYSMSQQEAVDKYAKLYPKIKGVKGRIKRYLSLSKEQERTFQQEERVEPEMVEVAFYYDISKKHYMVFAGAENVILHKAEGDDYPFVMNNNPYIPISQWKFIPSSQGFWNYGIGQCIYDLAIVSRRLLNMSVDHISQNTNPITLINLGKGESANFFNKLQLAHEMRAVGKAGYVAMEHDVNNPGSDRVQAQALLTQNLMSEWQIVFERLDRELRRLGIYLDDAGMGANPTATQILQEEENSNSFIKQVMEYNASESKFLIDATMDFIKKFIKKTDKTPLNLTTNMAMSEGGEVDLRGITMGMLADELKRHKYFVKMNARSGAIPSNVAQIVQVTRQMAVTDPSSKAYVKLWQKYAGLNDLELKAEDFTPQQAAQANPQELPPSGAVPTETEKLPIDPHQKEGVLT